MTDPMKGSPDRITSTKPRPQRSMDPAVHPAVQASEGRRKGPHVMVHKDLLAQLHERLSDARALLAEKDAEIEALEAERDNLQRWWREVSDEAKQLRALLAEKDAEIERLREEVGRLDVVEVSQDTDICDFLAHISTLTPTEGGTDDEAS